MAKQRGHANITDALIAAGVPEVAPDLAGSGSELSCAEERPHIQQYFPRKQ